MEKLQEIVKEIQKLYNTQEKDYVGYCIDRAELECEDEEQARNIVVNMGLEKGRVKRTF